MITEAITIGIILGGSAVAVWLAKIKFQPEIEKSVARIEAEAIVARRKTSHND